MKNINTLIITIAIAVSSFAQAPQAFKYQAITRDESGNILINNTIGLRISMVEGNKDGIAKYVETHKVKSNPFGIINIVIGKGEAVKGDFANINWGEESYFVKMEMDITGGTDYKEMGASQLYAVPYALYAEQAGSIVSKKAEQHAPVQKNPSLKQKTNRGSRDGTPNSKFPADTSSYLNVNAGYVGIGTTDPREKLEVNGNILANNMILTDPNGNQWEIMIDTTGTMHLADKFVVCGDSLYDYRDGQYYQTVLIGTQCWMAENINIGTRIVGATNQTDNLLIEKYCFNDIEDSCDVYGGLYQWNEMMQYVLDTGAQGICPPTGGWHIPSDEEWTSLVNYLDGPSIAGGKMKSTGTIEAGTGLWFSPNTGATNESGFTGLPDGIRRYTDGYFFQHGDIGHFWSSTQGIVPSAMSRRLSYGNTSVSRFSDFNRNSGFSVRCILN